RLHEHVRRALAARCRRPRLPLHSRRGRLRRRQPGHARLGRERRAASVRRRDDDRRGARADWRGGRGRGRDPGGAQYGLPLPGGTVVTPTTTESLEIAVQGERIAAIEPPGVLGAGAAKVIDATGCYVIPGGVDPHVHYSLGFPPVFGEPQDFSPAAACGGTTTIVDFALQEAPRSLHEAIEDKK